MTRRGTRSSVPRRTVDGSFPRTGRRHRLTRPLRRVTPESPRATRASACPRPERRRRPHRVRPDPKRRRRRTPAAATRARPPLRREHEPSSGLLRTAALNSTRLPAGLETPTFRRGPRVLGRLHRDPRFAGDNEEVPEETPEQVMARLARYADSLRRAPGGPIDPAR